MFSVPSGSADVQLYNFESEENAHKWKRLFINPLQKVLEQVHPTLTAKDDALEYVESLILSLLATLCARPSPHTVQDVEERVQRTFPNPIDRWAIGDAQAAIEKGKKKSSNPLVLPADKVHPLLKDVLQTRIDYQVTLYIVAVLEYISADILKLAGNYVKNIKHVEVSQQDIRVAMCADKVLMDMFQQDEDGESIEEQELSVINDTQASYDELVKDIIMENKNYIRELNMIIKVFRDKIEQIPFFQGEENRQLDMIFSNITEILEFSTSLLGSMEDTLEVTDENESPAIGMCFEEAAEGLEFDVYGRFAQDVLNPRCGEALMEVVSIPEVSDALNSAGRCFKEAVKYYLPKLLLEPVCHVFTYFKCFEMLLAVTEDDEGRESLEQVKGLLYPLRDQLERTIQNSPYERYLNRKLRDINTRHGRMSRQATLKKMSELQTSIDQWEGKDIAQCCNEFVLEGDLMKLVPTNRRPKDRHVFLFDGLIVICKSNNRRSSVTGQVGDYRFKERFLMRMVEIRDREDTDEIKHAFEIQPRDKPSVILLAKNAEDKNMWMAALVMLNARSMLERILDSILLEEEKKHPLRLPDHSVYQFAIQDSPSNIMIEEKENSGTPLIKGATLPKLVERLTYHMYADPMFVRTFLTTYRSFCTPMELLDLLIKRFEIPEPEFPIVSDEEAQEVKNQAIINRESLKRFRKEYSQPVQFRVLNVLRHWVDYHFYDFERDRSLLDKLQNFLERVKGKSMKKWVESITKIIQRRRNEEQREITLVLNRSPPSPVWHIRIEQKDWEQMLPMSCGGILPQPDLVRPLLMLHPIEIARQLTLLEFELYRAVKPSELVGVAWTKADKEKRSPNLLKMIHHTNNVTHWFSKCIVDCGNFEERVAVMARVVEIMVMFHDLNNFSGLFEVSSALESAAVHRLELTKAEVRKRLPELHKRIYEEALELSKDHYRKYQMELRSINPPCVPFFGMYLTNILHIEEGNPNFLQNAAPGLINFSKRRKVAEITGEIQQYQNQPYCLEVEPSIRHFMKTLQPFEGFESEHDIDNYLFNHSKEIEPKNCKKLPTKERQWPNLILKSPGIKPRNSRNVPHPLDMFTNLNRPNRLGDGADGDDHILTPTSPSTTAPSTPSQSPLGSSTDNSVFVTIEIGQISRTDFPSIQPIQRPLPTPLLPPVAPAPVAPVPLPLPQAASNPPPLPPRKQRLTSLGDTSPKVKQAPDAPELPPRDMSPPPIPPRSSTLPRMPHTSGGHHHATHHHHTPLGGHTTPHHIGSTASGLHHLHHSLHHLSLNHSRAGPTAPDSSNRPPPLPAPPLPGPMEQQLPLHRRNNSIDLSSPSPMARRNTANGPHSGHPFHSNMSTMPNDVSSDMSDSPPPPPPRIQQYRHTFAFTYDHQQS